MVEVVLDLAVYPFELGYEVVQKPDVMHKLERLHYPLVRPENIEEGAVYLPAPPEFVVYKIDPSPQKRLGVNREANPLLLCILEDFHQDWRIALDNRFIGHYQFPADDENSIPDRAPDKISEYLSGAVIALPATGYERCGEMFGPVRMDIVITHELFNGQRLSPVLETAKSGERYLRIECYLVVFPPRKVVKFVSELPEIRFCGFERIKLLFGKHPFYDQLAHRRDLVLKLGHPDRGLNIPEPALALLYVRFEDVDR